MASRTESRVIDGTIVQKKCSKCNEFKILTEFGLKITGHLGCRPWCKQCVRNYAKENYLRDRDYKLNYFLTKTLNKFNLTIENYKELISNGCLICGKFDGELHIDHCHKSNKFRGILCENCNHGLGLFKDNPDNLLKAAHYLEEFNKKLEIEELKIAEKERN